MHEHLAWVPTSAVWRVKCEVWSVKCEVWRKQWEVRSVKCGVWSVKGEVWSLKSAVWSEVWSAKWAVWSVKCGVWSVKCGVWRVQWEVWSAKWSFKCDMWNRTALSQNARTHGPGWRTVHASSIGEKGLIVSYSISLRQLPPRLVRVLLVYIYILWLNMYFVFGCIWDSSITCVCVETFFHLLTLVFFWRVFFSEQTTVLRRKN